MSIRRKVLVFISSLILFPMLFLLIISSFVLDRQIEKSAQNYLENALKIARNLMLSRLESMQKGSETLVKSVDFQKSLQEENIKNINRNILTLKEVNDFLDFIIIFNKDKKMLASHPIIKNPYFTELNRLLKKAEKSKNTITSEQVFPLNDLFPINSDIYNKYLVKISEKNDADLNNYLEKCQVGVLVTPVLTQDKEEILGYLVVADISNNDKYFPESYSMNVKDSYLAISVDGIRVTSNIRSPKQENFIGSPIPITMNTLEGPRSSYFGRVNIDNEVHLFLDEPIYNDEGKLIGALGVGIPEHRFSVLIDTNRNIIFLVTILCLVIMLWIGRKVANHLTQPVIKATEFAEQISKGKKDLVLEDKYLKNPNSETTILLKTFQKMASDLKKVEEERKEYMERLQQKHFQQQKLSEQLKILNDELEEKVQARTQDLHQAIIALKKADEVKSRFLANMSHELRTPLNAIICSSEVLKDGIFGSLNEKQHKYIENIYSSSVHLLQLINDILDISKIEAGKMTLSLGIYSILELIEDSLSIVKSLAYRKNIDLSYIIKPADFKIKVDAQKFKQIMYNLLSNAIKFTPEKGKVTIEIFKQDNFVQVSVKDTGIGIKEEDQEKVFKEFEQVDTSYERQYEGTGLGLPLTKKLVEMHGGEIFLISKVGIGTEVLFTLPVNIEDINGNSKKS